MLWASRLKACLSRLLLASSAPLQDIESQLGVRIRFFVGLPHKASDRVEKELQAEMREVRGGGS